jgi:hypothetical protein
MASHRRSKVVLFFAVLGAVYTVVVTILWSRAQSALTDLFLSDPLLAGLGTVAGGVASIVLLPHYISAVFASVLAAIGFLTRNEGFILAASTLFCVAVAMFFLSGLLLLPVVILGFIGYANQRRLNAVSAN